MNGETTTPCCIRTCGHTFLVSVVIDEVPTVLPSGAPTKIGVAELATTVGKWVGTPGELTALGGYPLRYTSGR